ncbi:hypothetical protein T439DRAFT_351711 [Meredithblackwellia eburnea MCA 4105]
MATPIADAYSTSLPKTSSLVLSHREGPKSSSSSCSSFIFNNDRQHHLATHRTSVSIKPTDDPFASTSDLVGRADLTSGPLGGEEWRISEEGSSSAFSVVSGEAENGAPMALSEGTASGEHSKRNRQKLERRPSFIKSLLGSKRKSRSSTSISGPIINDDVPPRLGPIRTSASLVSLRDAKRDSVYSVSMSTTSNFSSLRVASPPPGTHSLVFPRPPLSHAHSSSIATLGHDEGNTTSSFSGMSSLAPPPRTSLSRKPSDGGLRLGPRASLYTEEDRKAGFGLALTTNATRYIKPDNSRRVSQTSYTTFSTGISHTTISEGRNRDTVHSAYAPSSVQSIHEEEEPPGINEESSRMHRFRSPPSERVRSTESTPPLPPLPFKSETLPTSPKPSEKVPPRAPPPPPPGTTTGPSLSRRASADAHQSKSGWLPGLRRGSASHSVKSLPISPPKTSTGPNSTPPGPTKTVACMYLVSGLPKDPSTWALSDHADSGAQPPAHVPNALMRFWRPEVLGCSTTADNVVELDDFLSAGGRKGTESFEEALAADQAKDGIVVLTKEEIARIQSKAMKLAFNRDVEIVATTAQPPSTLSTFSFTIPTSRSSTNNGVAGSTAAAWDSALEPISSVEPETHTTYHASCLLVWSHADPARAAAIQATLQNGAKAKAVAIQRAVKAASASKKLGAKLARQMTSPMGAVPMEGKEWGRGAISDTDGETDIGNAQQLRNLSLPFHLQLHFGFPSHWFLSHRNPYALRISWARYHQDISQHSLHMRAILSLPCPRPGELVRLPVSASQAQANTHFIARMPGRVDWAIGARASVDFLFWPVFRALDADNLLTIAEAALAPLGRVLFISNYPVMLGLATSVFNFILEERGWKGLVHSTAHSRDVRILVEDPGPWLLSIPGQSRFVALGDLPPEIAVVDLDSNSVRIQRPHPGSISTGSIREKARKRLADAIGLPSSYYHIPSEFHEAFPGGRFRPFSEVEVNGQPKDAERLHPDAAWDWDQNRVLSEFDAILKEAPPTSLLRKLFRVKSLRKVQELEPGTLHVQEIVRKHASTFIDRRDLLENRINKLNGKLARLMAESSEWQASLEVFKTFSEKLTRESSELKTKLEKERREARRLTGQVTLERDRLLKLEASLVATDSAREQALQQLAEVEDVRTALERQQALLRSEIQAVLAADESSPLFEAVYSRLDSISHQSDLSSRPGTSMSTRRHHFRPSSPVREEIDEDEIEHVRVTENTDNMDDTEESRVIAMKAAVQEAFASIQSRLAIVLRNADQLDADAGRSIMAARSKSPGPQLRDIINTPDTPPPSATPSPNPIVDEEATAVQHQPPTHQPRRFKPKPFQLSPPTSPDFESGTTPHSFMTARTSFDSVPRTVTMRSASRSRHRPNDSIASCLSYRTTDDISTPSTARPEGSFTNHVLARQPSANSFGVVKEQRAFESPASQQSDFDDAESFVSFEELAQDRPGSAGSFGDSFESDDGVTPVSVHRPFPSVSSQGRSSEEVPDGPIEGSVELFTRSASVNSRRAPFRPPIRLDSQTRPRQTH